MDAMPIPPADAIEEAVRRLVAMADESDGYSALDLLGFGTLAPSVLERSNATQVIKDVASEYNVLSGMLRAHVVNFIKMTAHNDMLGE